MMKNLLCFGFLLLLSSTRAQVPSFTLEEATRYALEHSTAVKNAQIAIADAEGQILESAAIGMPQLNLGVDYQYNLKLPSTLVPAQFFDPNAPEGEFAEVQFGTKQNAVARVDLQAQLFDFSWVVGLIAAREFKKFTQQQYEATQLDVRHRVRTAYLPALLIQSNLDILERNIANVQRLLDETRALYREGFVEQLDVDRLELSLSTLSAERDNLLRQKAIALNRLKFVIGYPIEAPLEVSDSFESLLAGVPSQDSTASISFDSRPEYRTAATGVYLNELNVKRFRAGYLPSLHAFGSYAQNLQGDKLDGAFRFPSAMVGLSLKMPLFDGLYKKALIQRARLDLEEARNNLQELGRSITLEVQNARVEYANALRRLENQQRTLELAQKIYDTALVKYKEGVGSSLETAQAEQTLYDAQRNYTQAMYDLLLARYNLNKALGK